MRSEPLTALRVRAIKEPGRYSDGGRGAHGLYLMVRRRTNGRLSKTWCQRIAINGQRTNLGLGRYPITSLKQAREAALANRRAVADGKDPRGDATIPTFAQAAEKVIALHREGWKKGSKLPTQWRQTLGKHAYPHIGQKRLDKITTADVLAVLTPIWHSKPSAARITRQRIAAIMKWAIAKGYRTDNPAGDALTAALPKQGNGPKKHHAAIPYKKLPAVLQRVRESDRLQLSARLAFQLVALTATRSVEVRGARWSEMDMEARVWTIPASRMKAKRPHRVPLSDQAIKVLQEAHPLRSLALDDEVFPGSGSGGPIHNRALPDVLKSVWKGKGTVHGLRTAFRSWCADTAVVREVAEACLAHVVKNQTKAAYARSDMIERRREVMADWGAFIG